MAKRAKSDLSQINEVHNAVEVIAALRERDEVKSSPKVLQILSDAWVQLLKEEHTLRRQMAI